MRQGRGCLLILFLAFFSPAAVVGLPDGEQNPVAKAKPSGKDSFGDPLPDGAFYRLGTVRMRHEHPVTLIFSADGSQLLSQGMTSDLRVWDVATGRILQQLAAPEGRRNLIATQDDRYLACVADSHRVLLIDKATGKELARWDHPTSWLVLAFSKDGKDLIGLTREQTVVRWNIADRKEVGRIQLDMTKVDVKNFSDHWHLCPDGSTAAFMPDGATGTPGMPWRFWDTTTGKQCRPPLNTLASPGQVRWSPDGRTIAVVCRQGNTVEVWETVEGKRVALESAQPLKKGAHGKIAARCTIFHPKGKLLAVANDNTVAVWDVDAKKRLWEKKLFGEILTFSPDGKTLAVAGWGTITLLETATGERLGFSRQDFGGISLASGWWNDSPSFSNQGRSFMVHDEAGLSELETSTGKRLRTYYFRKNGWGYGGLCGDGSLFACVGNDVNGEAQVFMFDAADGKELWRRPKQPSAIHFAADGKKVAVLSWKEDEFSLLDAATGREIKKLPAPSYHQDGNTLKSVSGDLGLAASTMSWLKIDLWDLATGKKVRSLDCPSDWRNGSLYFVPGSKLLVGAPDRYFIEREKKGVWARVWDVGTGRVLHSFDEPILKMSDDGRWLSFQGDKGIAIRHLQTGRLVATLNGFIPYAGSYPLAFSPDGSLLAVRNATGHEVSLWDTFTGQLVRRCVDPLSEFDRVAFAPDGRSMVLGVRSGGSILVCDVTGRATEPGKIPPQKLTPAEADRYWLDLTSDDGPRSQRARWSLVAGGDHTVKMLQRSMPRVEPLDAKKVAALIADLDSGSFALRQKSSNLLELMELARPALEEALRRNPSLERKRRIELILAKQDGLPWDVELRRAMRGVLLLEQIATPSARQYLQTLAGGGAGSLLTQEAQAALQRLVRALGPHER